MAKDNKDDKDKVQVERSKSVKEKLADIQKIRDKMAAKRKSKRIPVKWMIYRMENSKTQQYYIGVDRYVPNKKYGNDKIVRMKMKGVNRKYWTRKDIKAFATEAEAYIAGDEMCTVELVNDPLSVNDTVGAVVRTPPVVVSDKDVWNNNKHDKE